MKLRAGVIGVGYLGNFHAQKLKAHPEVQLSAVCDYSQVQAEKVASELGCLSLTDYKQLIGKVDFVHVAASTQVHYEIAKYFLQNKIPVLVEKPIAATLSQAEELCELSEKNSTLFSVGHIERFNPAFNFLKEKKDGIRYLELNRLAPFRTRGSDVSVLHDLTIHDIDLVFWLFDSEIKEWTCQGSKMIKPTVDDVSIRLTLENHVQVTINNSRISPQIFRNFRAVKSNEVIVTNTANLETEIFHSAHEDPFYHIEKIIIPKKDALAQEVDHFVQSVAGRKKPAITGREALKALRWVETFVNKIEDQSL
jgi:predicted dehydrogenase